VIVLIVVDDCFRSRYRFSSSKLNAHTVRVGDVSPLHNTRSCWVFHVYRWHLRHHHHHHYHLFAQSI